MNELFTERELRYLKTLAGAALIAFVIGTLVGMVVSHAWDSQLSNYLLAENLRLTAQIESFQ